MASKPETKSALGGAGLRRSRQMPRYAEPAERTAVGARIDPATAEVWFDYASTLDPYCELDLEPELRDVGRQWFTRDPIEQIAVSFYDLPPATREALEGKRRAADWEGWNQLLSGAFG
jgi:hypothetical protein